MNERTQRIKELLKSKADPSRWAKWLLMFAETDLERFKEQEWEQLEKELKSALDSCYDLAALWKEPQARPSSKFLEQLNEGIPRTMKDRKKLKFIQSKLREMLNILFPDELNEISFHVGVWEVPIRKLNLEFHSAVKEKTRKHPSRRSKFRHVYSADWPDIFWLLVKDLLDKQGGQLHRCLQCRKLYLKFKRQAYCSKQCSQQRRTREYYEKHHETVREKRRQSYEEKMREQHSERIKIRRNRSVRKNK